MNLKKITYIISFILLISISMTGCLYNTQPETESKGDIITELKENIDAEISQNAASESSAKSKEDAPVIIDGIELFTIKVRVTSFYPEDRANLIRDRVVEIAKNRNIAVEDIQLKESSDGNIVEIVANGSSISTITQADADAEGLPLQTVAEDRKDKIQEAVLHYRDLRKAQKVILQFLKAVLLTALLITLLYFTRKVSKYFRNPVSERRFLQRHLSKIPIGRFLPIDTVQRITGYVVLSLIAILRLFLLYFYLSLVLGLFPWTAAYSKQLLSYVYAVFYTLGNFFVDYLPNILVIIVIVFISRQLRKVIFFFFRQVRSENIKISGFYPEWADTTYKIAMFFLVAITAIVLYPYVPGTQSLAFQSVTVFFSLLLSFGSSSLVANIVAGVALTYTRSFKIGDRVKIGENVGDIMEKSMFSIRMRTVKNEDITIPNSTIINNPVVNYSSSSVDSALILHLTVTLGYDVPWQTANKVLIEAALMTNDILHEPRPFVLQRKLNDFSVSHEINAFTHSPNRMAAIYSEMYKNIIDKLKEANIDLNVPQQFVIRENTVDVSEKDESDM